MDEYIKRDALLEELDEEIAFETSMYTEEQNNYFKMGLKCAYRDVKSQPTADVVPRADYENLKIELEAMRGAANSYKLHYEGLAREIFEEIDCLFEKYFAKCSQKTEIDLKNTLRQAECGIINEIWHEISKCKKKYTKGDEGE